jgi:membrane-associated protease RseP (regulator of RpoE activity)
VLLSGQGDGTRVELIHSCIGSEEIWAEARKSIASGWEKSLENLESVLTTGVDQRVINRPAIGIYPIELNPELAAISGLPVTSGIYLSDVIPGRSADQAGLSKGDVIVAVDGEAVSDLNSFVRIFQSCQPGDQIKISYYRGKQKQETTLDILALPVPEIPLDPFKLAAAARKSYEEINQALYSSFSGLADESAGRKIDTGWNAKEVLVHLIHTERDLQLAIQSALVDQEFKWIDNTDARIKASLAVFPTYTELIEELNRAQAETVAFIEALPADFTARKSSMWRLGYTVLTMKYHTQEHLSQIERAIQRI